MRPPASRTTRAQSNVPNWPFAEDCRASDGVAGVIDAAVVVPLVVFGQVGSGGRSAVSAADDSLGVVDARSGRLVADTGVGATPAAVAAGEGAYWVTNAGSHTVSRIDPGTTQI